MSFTGPAGVNHDALSLALKKAIYTCRRGMCREGDVRRFFHTKVTKPTLKPDFVAGVGTTIMANTPANDIDNYLAACTPSA